MADDTKINKNNSRITQKLFHRTMGSWDKMDSGTHMNLQEGQVDMPWNVHGVVGWDGQSHVIP